MIKKDDIIAFIKKTFGECEVDILVNDETLINEHKKLIKLLHTLYNSHNNVCANERFKKQVRIWRKCIKINY